MEKLPKKKSRLDKKIFPAFGKKPLPSPLSPFEPLTSMDPATATNAQIIKDLKTRQIGGYSGLRRAALIHLSRTGVSGTARKSAKSPRAKSVSRKSATSPGRKSAKSPGRKSAKSPRKGAKKAAKKGAKKAVTLRSKAARAHDHANMLFAELRLEAKRAKIPVTGKKKQDLINELNAHPHAARKSAKKAGGRSQSPTRSPTRVGTVVRAASPSRAASPGRVSPTRVGTVVRAGSPPRVVSPGRVAPRTISPPRLAPLAGDLSSMLKKDLHAYAKRLGLTHLSQLNKPQLEAAIRAHLAAPNA